MRHTVSRPIILLALVLLWLPAAAYGWNALSPWDWGSPRLVGVQVKASETRLSLEALSNRSFQDGVARAVGSSIPFFGDAVRLHNQLLYGAFGLSPSHHVLIGKGEYLLNPVYTSAYCQRDIVASAEPFRRWARLLAETQQMIEARGQIFLYVLTPSKVEHMPEAMPPGFPCLSDDRQRFIAAALSYLDAAGVKYLDATAQIHRIKQTYGYEPFTRYGIHWTDLAAYPATMDIVRAINDAKGHQAIIPYEIAVGPAARPALDDYDYASLLNVLWTPKPRDVAAFSIATSQPPYCPEPTNITTVGGSFFKALGRNLSRGPCPPNVVQLFYLTLETVRFETGRTKSTQAEYGLIATADVIIVEENAGILLKTRHISALHDYLRTGRLPEGGLY
jgi:alginate O-acetyltransferase complex protein AlgJ